MNKMNRRRRRTLVFVGLALALFGILALAFAFSTDITVLERATIVSTLLPPGGVP
jgi:uncharacterized membrane protein HdeD (DUF308 family)